MSNPATVEDLVARWRPLSTQEQVNAEAFLDDAWAMLRSKVVNVETRIAASSTFAAEVVRVLCTSVLRVMKNPNGAYQETIDDYSYTRDRATAGGELYFTDRELDALAEGASRGRAFSFSVLPVGYPDETFK